MSDALATVDLQTSFSETDVSSLGVLSRGDNESGFRATWNAGGFFWNAGRVLASAGILAFAASSATAVSDVWSLERRRLIAFTVPWVSEGMIGRSISRSEALRIARQIIERAEQERIQFAEWEAERGIYWEDGA